MASPEEPISADKLLSKITGVQKIDRETGLATLSRIVKSSNGSKEDEQGNYGELIGDIRSKIALTLESKKEGEVQATDKYVGCLSASLILISGAPENESEGVKQFISRIRKPVLGFLSDEDVRVRLTAGELYGFICKVIGPEAYKDSKDCILEVLKSEFERNKEVEGMVKSPETPIDPTGEVASAEPHSSLSPQLGLSPASTPIDPNTALSEVLKEACLALKSGVNVPASAIPSLSPEMALTLGCAKLESSLKCLQFIARGLGSQFGQFVDQSLLDLIYPALSHQNRFVRETGFFLCGTIIETGIDLKKYGKQLSLEATKGLSDFCSQARIASAIASRKLLLSVGEHEREEYYAVVLPKLCLCRYYMADTKFLLYSQETWRILFGTCGPELVAKYISDVVSYYIEATSSDNHAVREAACACMGELARKIDRNALVSHVPALIETLRRCFKDERWHVRDAACLASGNFLVNYPPECKDQLQNLYPLFWENLEFPISIVRQGAAAAIANAVRAYGNEIIPQTISRIQEGLAGIEKQPAENCKNADTLGISPEIKYSYPPEKGAHFIPYARPSHPWELCDGCLYLIGDIAQVSMCQTELPGLIPIILKATQFRTFSQHVVVLETTCKILPWLVKGIGKRPFKEYLSQFFEVIFYSIECENSLTSAAGKVCLQELAQIYGPNIIRSRIELFDPRRGSKIFGRTVAGRPGNLGGPAGN